MFARVEGAVAAPTAGSCGGLPGAVIGAAERMGLSEEHMAHAMLAAGMIGVFISLDFMLFYVFWELVLVPMYFIIGVWGGPRKLYAAIKFFLYTLAGGVLMWPIVAMSLVVLTFGIERLIALRMADFGEHELGSDGGSETKLGGHADAQTSGPAGPGQGESGEATWGRVAAEQQASA